MESTRKRLTARLCGCHYKVYIMSFEYVYPSNLVALCAQEISVVEPWRITLADLEHNSSHINTQDMLVMCTGKQASLFHINATPNMSIVEHNGYV